MGGAGVCTSGCMLGLRQYVRGSLSLYHPDSRHLAQAWFGRVFRRSQRVGEPWLLQRNRLSDSLLLPKGGGQSKCELAALLYRAVWERKCGCDRPLLLRKGHWPCQVELPVLLSVRYFPALLLLDSNIVGVLYSLLASMTAI